MWIESTSSFEIQYITEGLQIDKAGFSPKIQLQEDKTCAFYVKAGMTQDSKLASSTSCALFWMKWSCVGISGIRVRPDTGYALASMAKQLNSETVKT